MRSCCLWWSFTGFICLEQQTSEFSSCRMNKPFYVRNSSSFLHPLCLITVMSAGWGTSSHELSRERPSVCVSSERRRLCPDMLETTGVCCQVPRVGGVHRCGAPLLLRARQEEKGRVQRHPAGHARWRRLLPRQFWGWGPWQTPSTLQHRGPAPPLLTGVSASPARAEGSNPHEFRSHLGRTSKITAK